MSSKEIAIIFVGLCLFDWAEEMNSAEPAKAPEHIQKVIDTKDNISKKSAQAQKVVDSKDNVLHQKRVERISERHKEK